MIEYFSARGPTDKTYSAHPKVPLAGKEDPRVLRTCKRTASCDRGAARSGRVHRHHT